MGVVLLIVIITSELKRLTKHNMKILIIRFSSIGDIVLTTPVVRCVKQQTDCEIHFLTKKKFEKILENNPHVKKVWTIKKNVSEIFFEKNILKILFQNYFFKKIFKNYFKKKSENHFGNNSGIEKENFDVIIDLHNNLRSRLISFLLGAKTFRFDKLNFEKWLLVNFKINRLPKIHIVDRYLKTVVSLNVKNDGAGLDYFITDKDVVNIPALTNYFIYPNGYIAFVIGAAHATKQLPENKIVEICKKINLPIFLLGGKEDAERGEVIKKMCGVHVLNLCGQLNLNQSASVVQQAKQIITHDTGLMHIAAAFNKDIISFWGNTIPEFGMAPYLSNKKMQEKADEQMMEVHGLSCRPCSKIGFAVCPKGHFNCMNLQQITF